MRLKFLIFLLPGFIGACNSKDQVIVSGSGRHIDSLFKEYYTFKKRVNPIEATKAGFYDYNSQLANYISDPYQEDLLADLSCSR
jgi:hypothetical protein